MKFHRWFPPFSIDKGHSVVIHTGMKYRLQAAIIGAAMRKPSHWLNREVATPLMAVGMRVMGASKKDAETLAIRHRDYMTRSIEVQCDAVVLAPMGKKTVAMLESAFSDELVAESGAWMREVFEVADRST